MKSWQKFRKGKEHEQRTKKRNQQSNIEKKAKGLK